MSHGIKKECQEVLDHDDPPMQTEEEEGGIFIPCLQRRLSTSQRDLDENPATA